MISPFNGAEHAGNFIKPDRPLYQNRTANAKNGVLPFDNHIHSIMAFVLLELTGYSPNITSQYDTKLFQTRFPEPG
jgi:hypothetical protein